MELVLSKPIVQRRHDGKPGSLIPPSVTSAFTPEPVGCGGGQSRPILLPGPESSLLTVEQEADVT